MYLLFHMFFWVSASLVIMWNYLLCYDSVCLIRPRFLKLENVTKVVDDNNSALAGYVGVGVGVGLDVDVNVEFVWC